MPFLPRAVNRQRAQAFDGGAEHRVVEILRRAGGDDYKGLCAVGELHGVRRRLPHHGTDDLCVGRPRARGLELGEGAHEYELA